MKVPCGREDIARLFENCISKDKLAQAYILSAPQGMGKKTVLNYVLSLMLCKDHTSCGECLSCKSLEAGAHPDVVHLTREADKATLGVGRVRDIKNEVYTRPAMADYKAVVVYEAHLATIEAQNAMLKMIEEPPEKVVFFLLCDTMAPILPTIVSRAIVLNIKPLPAGALKEITGADDFQISICDGNVGRLKELTEDSGYSRVRDEVIDAFSSLTSEDPYTPYAVASRFDKLKENKEDVFDIILSFVRDAYCKKKNIDSCIINKDKMNYINAFASKAKEDALWRIMNLIVTTRKEKGKNGNFNIAVTILLLKCRRELR